MARRQSCRGNGQSPDPVCGPVSTQAEEEEEDVPMRRYAGNLNTSAAGIREFPADTMAALAEQNRILMDLMGSVNALTAAVLNLQQRPG